MHMHREGLGLILSRPRSIVYSGLQENTMNTNTRTDRILRRLGIPYTVAVIVCRKPRKPR